MFMSRIIFDIETGGLPENQIEFPEFEAPANYKSTEAITKYIEKKKQDYIEKAAVSCFTGEILAIGYQLNDNDIQVIHGLPEHQLISQFWNIISSQPTDTNIIGWNSNGFDFPFMIRKSWKYGIELPQNILTAYNKLSSRCIDLMLLWGCGIKEYTKLDTVAKFFNVGTKNGDGRFFKEMYIENKEKAIKYLHNDVFMTAAVADKML